MSPIAPARAWVQVGSRLGIFWGIVWSVPETRVELLEVFAIPGVPHARLALGLPSMYLCWAVSEARSLLRSLFSMHTADNLTPVCFLQLSEITRYTFYFCKVTAQPLRYCIFT